VITNWQREFQTVIGRNNARYFDQNGWLFFTKEDLISSIPATAIPIPFIKELSV